MLILAYDENDNIVHIKDAEKGKSYRCPDCGAEVRPKKGTKKTHHFFHMNAEDCGNSGESIVHKYYKELIASQKTVRYNGLEMMVTNSKIEQTLPNLLTGSHIIADVMLELNGYKWIAVEVCYKNHKDENHVDIYNALDMECFEVYVDINKEQTDFEITGYEKIASVQQYGEKIRQEAQNDFDVTINKKNEYIEKTRNEHNEYVANFEQDVLYQTGYYMCQLVNTYKTSNRSYTFLQLMREISFIVKKHNPDCIILDVKQYDECSHSYKFDINFTKNRQLFHKIEIIESKYCGSQQYHTHMLTSGSKNSVSYLYHALKNNYCYVTQYDERHGYTVLTYAEKRGFNYKKEFIKRRDFIIVFAEGIISNYDL